MALAEWDDRTVLSARACGSLTASRGGLASMALVPLSFSSEHSSGYPSQRLHVIRFKRPVFHKTHETRRKQWEQHHSCSADWELPPEESGKEKK